MVEKKILTLLCLYSLLSIVIVECNGACTTVSTGTFLTASKTDGGCFYLPAGTYYLNNNLEFTDLYTNGFTLKGDLPTSGEAPTAIIQCVGTNQIQLERAKVEIFGVTFKDCPIEAGIVVDYDSKLNLHDSVFNNSFVYVTGSSEATITDVVFDKVNTDSGVVFTAGRATSRLNRVTIKDSLTKYGGVVINGGGQVYINDSTIDNVQASASAGCGYALDPSTSLTCQNCVCTNSGGVVAGGFFFDLQATGSFNNSRFEGNTGSTAGGIYMTGSSTISISHSNFGGNTGTFGGGVHVTGSTAIFDTVIFDSNRVTSGGQGGGLYVISNGIAHVTNSVFSSNDGKSEGGAVWVKGELYMSSSTIFNCSSVGGAGVWVDDGIAVINSTKIYNNTASDFGAGVGAVHGSVTLNDCEIYYNSAESAAVGFIGNNDLVGHIDRCYIHHNEATDDSGAITISRATVTITNSDLSYNSATNAGGAMYMSSGTAFLINVTVTHNRATAPGYNTGGAIAIYRANLDAYNATFSFNNAMYGGAFIIQTDSVVNFHGSKFENNTALSGNTIFAFNPNTVVNIYDTEFYGNKATAITGASFFVQNNATFHMYNSKITYTYGVVFMFSPGIKGSINDCVVQNNYGETGSGVSIQADPSKIYPIELNITNTEWSHNFLTDSCVVYVYCYEATVRLNNNTFMDNYATYAPSACIYGGYMEVNNSRVTRNTAEVSSGGIVVSGEGLGGDGPTTLIIDNTELTYNSAPETGALYVMGAAHVTVTRSTFAHNIADAKAGAIVVGGEGTVVTMDDCDFYNNTASQGGVLYMNQGSMAVTNSRIWNNTGSYGGVFHAFLGELFIDTCTITNNTGLSAGGVFYSYRLQNTEVRNSDLSNNHAVDIGGGVLHTFDSARTTFIDCTLYDNTANVAGGALYINGAASATVSGTKIERSESPLGGAIFGYGLSTITINNSSSVSYNRGDTGGALHSFNCYISVVDSYINNNNAVFGGGIFIYANHTNLSVDRSVFNNNTASSGGAFYFFENITATITNSEMAYNVARNKSTGGAVVYSYDSAFNVSGCNIHHNKADYGPVFYVFSYVQLNVNNSTINNNEATDSGGVLVSFTKSMINVENTTMSNNKAVFGGVVYLHGDSVFTAKSSRFLNNIAVEANTTTTTTTTTGGASGSVIKHKRNMPTTTELNPDEVAKQKPSFGGAFYLFSSAKASLTDCTLNNNYAASGGTFYLFGGSDLLVKDSQLYNNAAETGGVFIAFDYTTKVKVSGSVFGNNTAETGGVFYLFGNSSTTIEGSTISGSVSTDPTTGGGAFYVFNTTLTIRDSIISKSKAVFGAGFYAFGGSTIVMNNTQHNNNQATDEGGAILLFGNTTTITLNNNTLQNNVATYAGGAVYLFNEAKISLVNSNFNQNSADLFGGAVFTFGRTTTTLNGCVFNNNTANSGGVIHAFHSGTTINIQNSEFSGNNAGDTGGVFYVYNETRVILNNSTMNNNKAVYGGVIYTFGEAVFIVTSSKFYNNAAVKSHNTTAVPIISEGGNDISTNKSSYGGVFYLFRNAKVNVTDSILVGNTAASGGAFYLFDGTTLSVKNSQLYNNNAETGGVFIVFSNTTTSTTTTNNANLNVGGCVFGNNRAQAGGVFYLFGTSTTTIDGSTITGNTATDATAGGGAFYLFRNTTVIIRNSVVSNNKAVFGAAFYLFDGASVQSNNTQHFNNRAQDEGGVFMFFGSTTKVTLYNNTLNNNYADAGGAIYLFYDAILNVYNSILNQNYATRYGGVVFTFGRTTTTFTNCVLKNNTALYGAVIHAFQINTTVTVKNSEISGNIAGDAGGVFYFYNQTHVIVHNAVFSYNNAGAGGVFYPFQSATLDVYNSTMTKNSANCYGGAVLYSFKQAQVNFYNSKVENNTATSMSGGAFYVFDKGTILNVRNATVSGNSAQTGGGAFMFFSSSTVSVLNSVVNNNNGGSEVTGGGGGAFYYFGNSSLTLQNSIVNSNYGFQGGAIMTFGANGHISNSSFVGNMATYGASLYASWFSYLDVENSTMIGNTNDKNMFFQPNNILTVKIKNTKMSNTSPATKFCCNGNGLLSLENQICNYPSCDLCGEATDGCTCPPSLICTSCANNATGPTCSEVPVVCPGTPECSGNGTCISGVCECFTDYSGPACDQAVSRTTLSTPPGLVASFASNGTYSTNTNSTNTNNNSTSTEENIGVKFDIGIKEIRELTGVAVVKKLLINESMVILRNEVIKYADHEDYVVHGSFGYSTLTVNISLYTTAASVNFADTIVSVSPYTLKYSFELSNWTFLSPQNRLQVVMQSASVPLNDSSSNVNSTVQSDSQGNLLYFVVDIGTHLLYGKMVPVMIVDDVPQNISSTTFSTTTGDVLIDLPHFEKTVVVDPNYAILLGVGRGNSGTSSGSNGSGNNGSGNNSGNNSGNDSGNNSGNNSGGDSGNNSGGDTGGNGSGSSGSSNVLTEDRGGITLQTILIIVGAVIGAIVIGLVIAMVIVPKFRLRKQLNSNDNMM